ncbi:efflux RND transporter permease subunit [Varunaivibrio sulfuroxidans]|uniref:HAE1 family hydrophobic/amphiphilic exporter-1 n=1 Tax=Varunaivibrio sulfuroxidans TaxID=1773489 RepID=A0A4R3J542_9PROT|nr:efflux RND transporter permease subunit [Varunaivibrio sulfuroxidans]TCS60354.1 HAE1 family hydrophobic/amphiphilic exporter-1 [Varunaivibrio sulfuroxidans]WES30958.1 efflux RND transporter permease subunit [Varunaivibrio sulfuroxidans]
MNLIKVAIERPIAVIAAVLMVVMFGLLALKTIPIQLIPDIRKPVLNVRTEWPGAAPAEVEREIVNRQEEALRGLQGLDEMTSRSDRGRATISLEFAVGQDMDKALLLVANRLDRVTDYPAEVKRPTLNTSDSEDQPIARFSLVRTPGNTRPLSSYGSFVETVIQDRLERVPGVAGAYLFGDVPRRLEVIVEPARLAQYGLGVGRILDALRAANASVSAGTVDEGKRRYVVRAEGELTTPEAVRNVVVRTIADTATGNVSRVRIGDIAHVAFGYPEPDAVIRRKGQPAIAISVVRDTGANVIDVMKGLKRAVAELNRSVLPAQKLRLEQIYDETVYITSAIDLVKQNIWVGGLLAALILYIFLRSWAATLIISVAIPVSVIGSFVAMAAMGRSLNVISLAGIAFAVGMVVDAAIVVLENIFRLRQEGLPPAEAAYKGAAQVWGAVLVSVLTTVLVFAPILVMKLEIGQLFRDIAVAISVSVVLSLIVAITVIPALANRLLRAAPVDPSARPLPLLDPFARWFTRSAVAFTHRVAHNRGLAIVVVLVVCGVSGASSFLFLPKMEYLPEGNRNLVFGAVIPPPGYNLATTTRIAQRIEDAVRPLWQPRKDGASDAKGPPRIANFFFIARSTTTFVGASAVDPARAGELIPILRKPLFKEPGTFGFMSQPSLFGRAVGSGRSIDVNISGPDLNKILAVAITATDLIEKILPRDEGNQLRPRPGLELGAPEVRIIPDPTRLANNAITTREFTQTVDAFNDGLRVAEITVDGQRLDLTLMGPQRHITRTQGVSTMPIVTASGAIVPLSSLAKVVVTAGPTEIRHIERERTVTIQVRPSKKMALESAIALIRKDVVQKLYADGLPQGVHVNLAGTANKLSQAWDAMALNLLIAIVIVYLVMAVLFESFIYPFVIVLSVPLATAGGVGGLALLNLFVPQPLDMLTLLGFIILIGIVVNNAILLVHQTLYHLRRDAMELEDAIIASTRNRIRPIFMSTLTSVVGMLPLVIFPGAGSELYRGLGSVVVGGLTLSAVLTLLIIPPMMTLLARFAEEDKGEGNKKKARPTERAAS